MACVANGGFSAEATAQARKLNIPTTITDDVGIWNISAYYRGMLGGRTPSIDRIAKVGARCSPTIRILMSGCLSSRFGACFSNRFAGNLRDVDHEDSTHHKTDDG